MSNRVKSGLKFLKSGRVGSGQKDFQIGSGRVGSERILNRVGSGRVRNFERRVGSGLRSRPDVNLCRLPIKVNIKMFA